MNSNGNIRHQAEVDLLYELLQHRISAMRSRYGRIPTPRDLPTARNAWRAKGVYFFFEPGEKRATGDAQRVVRVGSHRSDRSSIERRVVGEHSIDWGRSVFRRHVGTALVRKGEFDSAIDGTGRERWAGLWFSSVGQWPVHDHPNLLHPTLHALHPFVTATIGRMTLVWVEIPDRTDRLKLEEQCIKLLSNYLRAEAAIDPPSDGWLGRHALTEEVQKSGLWNVQHVKQPHTPGFLGRFQKYFLPAN